MSEPLLQVEGLVVRPQGATTPILNDISFQLAAGESVGVVGESGCGKTTLARTLIRLLPNRDWEVRGSVYFRGADVLRADESQLRCIRGAGISLIPQEPEQALNPVLQVGTQLDEVLRAHSISDRVIRRREIDAVLDAVGLNDEQVWFAYPHELSGGQRQRVAIAQSLVAKPALLIADEPTSALDNLTQADILKVIKNLKERFKLAVLFITHNAAILAGLAERLLVMRSGRIVEEGRFQQIYWSRTNEYSTTLMSAVAPEKRAEDKVKSKGAGGKPILGVRHLSKSYGNKRGLLLLRHRRTKVALDDISLEIAPSSTMALVGRSGAGKSTLGRCVALMETPDCGEIEFDGQPLSGLNRGDRQAIRRRIQLIFQHSAAAMNPTFTALEAVAEPLLIQGATNKSQCHVKALGMLERVGISPIAAGRRIAEFSGGQRQRIAIARALVLEPKLLVLDEALAGLDPAMQLQIADMLINLQQALSLSYLFISHDLQMAVYLAHRMSVLEGGRIVETGSVEQILASPRQPITRGLVASIPVVLPEEPCGPDTVQ